MSSSAPPISSPRSVTSRNRRWITTTVVAAVGVSLFVYAVRQAGVGEIAEGMGRVGWGLLLIIALAGLRFVVRTQCWRLCLPASARLEFRPALLAFLAGDAVGSVTPLGLLASEPTKVFLTRHHLATRESVASLTLENLVYSASVLAMIVFGAALLLAAEPLPTLMRQAISAALVVALSGAGVAFLALRSRRVRARVSMAIPRVAALGSVVEEIRRFRASEPSRLVQVFLLDLFYHAVAVLEVFVTLDWLMDGRGPTFVMAVVFETLNRVVTVVFKFVPFRVGVDEALSGALAPLVAVDPVSGVALAVVRKVRSLFWAAVGLGAIALHPSRDNDPTS